MVWWGRTRQSWPVLSALPPTDRTQFGPPPSDLARRADGHHSTFAWPARPQRPTHACQTMPAHSPTTAVLPSSPSEVGRRCTTHQTAGLVRPTCRLGGGAGLPKRRRQGGCSGAQCAAADVLRTQPAPPPTAPPSPTLFTHVPRPAVAATAALASARPAPGAAHGRRAARANDEPRRRSRRSPRLVPPSAASQPARGRWCATTVRSRWSQLRERSAAHGSRS